MALNSGMKLGPYEILSPLGAGGMGEVYRARDTRLGREVALKILPESFAREPDRLHRFEQEARAVAALNHPNILAIFDTGQENGSPYLVSELLEGETLREILDGGALPQRKAIDYGVQMAQGLAAAHEKGIVHRDLKPENIFVSKDGRVKILDFGLAKLAQSGPVSDSVTLTHSHTAAGVVLGTASYMAPEQVRGGGVDARTDIFAFGAVLYEMLSGQAGVSPRYYGRNHDGGAERRPGGVGRSRACGFTGAGPDCAALPGEESGAAVSVGEGFVVCAERSFGIGYGGSAHCSGAEQNSGLPVDFGSGRSCVGHGNHLVRSAPIRTQDTDGVLNSGFRRGQPLGAFRGWLDAGFCFSE